MQIGITYKLITSRLNAYKPIGFKICNNSVHHDQLQDHKFQGKPVSILPLKKSVIDKLIINKIKEEKLIFTKGPIDKKASPKNKPNVSGIKITAKGIRNSNLSSKVKE